MPMSPTGVETVTPPVGAASPVTKTKVPSMTKLSPTRIMLILCELAETFGSDRPDGAIEIEVPITQSELATLVGSTRQSVNASLGELTDQGLIAKKGRHLIVPKLEELRRAALPVS